MTDGVREWYMDQIAKQERDRQVRAAMVAIGPEALCEPAGPDDDRTLTPWLASLAAVGLSPMLRSGVEDNIEHMAPEVRGRAKHALKLIKVFEARARRKSENLTDAIPVLDFLEAVTPFSTQAQPVNPLSHARTPVAALHAPVAAPAEAVPVPEAGHRRPPTVQETIAPYVAKLMQERPESTAEDLYQRMRRDAGVKDSPFSQLTKGGELFCVEPSKPCGIATVRAALTCYRKRHRSTVEVPSNP